MQSVRIRPFQDGDGEALAAIYRHSVAEIGPRHYSQAQIDAWLTLAPPPAVLEARSKDGRHVLVAIDHADHPIAFADLESDGHIDLFYCAPEAAGTGVASMLYDAIEDLAAAHGLDRLVVEASEAARGLFARKGFVQGRRRELSVGGTTLHNYAMTKVLGPCNVRGDGQREPVSDCRRGGDVQR